MVGIQFLQDEFRIETFDNPNDAFEHHFASFCFGGDAGFDFVGCGEKDDIGNANTVNGGDKGYSDAVADLIDVSEIFHDLNEAENSTDDPDGGGIAAGGFKDFGFGFGVMFFYRDMKLHGGAEFVEVTPIDSHVDGTREEGVGDLWYLIFQGNQASLAGLIGEENDFVHQITCGGGWSKEDFFESSECPHEHWTWGVDADGSQGTAQDDNCRRNLSDILQLAAFEDQASGDASNGECEPTHRHPVELEPARFLSHD